MLKKVGVSQLRPGMYVHDLGMSWWKHGFLRPRFLLDDSEMIAAVRAAGVTQVVIDLARGSDAIAPADPVVAQRAALAPPPEAPAALAGSSTKEGTGSLAPGGRWVSAGRSTPSGPTVSVEEETRAAKRLLKQARAAIEQAMGDARSGSISNVSQVRDIADGMVESLDRNAGALLSLAGLKSQDDYTFMHCVAVGTFMIALGRTLGLPPELLREAGTAGLLHDVGKSLVPLEILNKPGRLTPEEFIEVRKHPALGHRLLLDAGCEEAAALDVVLHHHERIDGRGYPDALAGEAVTQLSRMGAVVDVYDAVSSDRVYHSKMQPTAALKMLMANGGSQFDEAITRAFVRTIGIYPNGSLVRLRSGRLAVVIEQHDTDARTPRVRAFFSTRSNLHVAPETIALARGTDEIMGAEDPRRWNVEPAKYLPE